MYKKIYCTFNDNGGWCKNKNIKRSLFGFGARLCLEYEDKECHYKEIPYERKKGLPEHFNQNKL